MAYTTPFDIEIRVCCALEHIALALAAETLKQPAMVHSVMHGKECRFCAPLIVEPPPEPYKPQPAFVPPILKKKH